jgi:hypothetical protein
MITYDWNCKTVDVHPQEESETNVVYNVHWIVTGVKEDYSVSNIGTQMVPLDPDSEFIPFEDLTNEIVVGWTKQTMGTEQVTQIEDNIASQIAELENPTSVTMVVEE